MPLPKPRTTINYWLIYLTIALVFCYLQYKIIRFFPPVIFLFGLGYLILGVLKYKKDNTAKKYTGASYALFIIVFSSVAVIYSLYMLVQMYRHFKIFGPGEG